MNDSETTKDIVWEILFVLNLLTISALMLSL